MARCTSHCRQACCVAGRLGVVFCDCAAVMASGIGGLEADVVGLDVCRAALVVAGKRVLDLVGDLAWEVLES